MEASGGNEQAVADKVTAAEVPRWPVDQGGSLALHVKGGGLFALPVNQGGSLAWLVNQGGSLALPVEGGGLLAPPSSKVE